MFWFFLKYPEEITHKNPEETCVKKNIFKFILKRKPFIIFRYWSKTALKCVACPAQYSNVYSISGGTVYAPYYCYNYPYNSRSATPANNWQDNYNYCNNLGVTDFFLLRVEDSYDVRAGNYFYLNWCTWMDTPISSSNRANFVYGDGYVVPTPYSGYYYAPANTVLLWANGFGLYSYSTSGQCAIVCQYGS